MRSTFLVVALLATASAARAEQPCATCVLTEDQLRAEVTVGEQGTSDAWFRRVGYPGAHVGRASSGAEIQPPQPNRAPTDLRVESFRSVSPGAWEVLIRSPDGGTQMVIRAAVNLQPRF